MLENAYKSNYKQLQKKYDQALDRMLELEDEKNKAINEKNKAIEEQQHLQTQNNALLKELEQKEISLNDLQNQITDLKDELEIAKRSKGRKSKYTREDAQKIHDSLKKYGGTLSIRAASGYFKISTSTIQLLMNKYY